MTCPDFLCMHPAILAAEARRLWHERERLISLLRELIATHDAEGGVGFREALEKAREASQ
jgi:hypothetical protein